MTFLKCDLSESSGGNAETIGPSDFRRGESARNSRNVATIDRADPKLCETEKLDTSVVRSRDSDLRREFPRWNGDIGGRSEGAGEGGVPYDAWESKSNFRSFVKFVCSEE